MMTFKKVLLQALISTVLASAACIIYNIIYSKAFYVDFSKVLNPLGIIIACLTGCVLMALAYFAGMKWKGEASLGWTNIIISILSFVSITGVLGIQLPLDVESPEMFPGLAIPMHFFPALSFFAIAPFFRNKVV